MHTPTGDSESQGHLDSRIGDFPAGLVVEIHTSTGGGTGLIPDQETRIPHATQTKINRTE